MNRDTLELLRNPPRVIKYLPRHFRETSPMNHIANTMDNEFSKLSVEMISSYNNAAIHNADESTLEMYEFMYGVNAPYVETDIHVYFTGDTPPANVTGEKRFIPLNTPTENATESEYISKALSGDLTSSTIYLVDTDNVSGLVEYLNGTGMFNGLFATVSDTDYIIYLDDVNILGERRARLANRDSMKPPFTKRFLENKLNELLGEGNYNLTINYATSEIRVESTNSSQTWAEEVYITINNIKPASMVYINIPVDMNEIIIEEGINLSQFVYNYRLGTQWVLGRKPFVSFENLGEVKSMAINSFTPLAHNKTASFLITDVAKVRINGTQIISTFVSKQTVDNVGELVYAVPQGLVPAVNKVELLDSSNRVLSVSNFYVPIPDTTQIKHRFRVRNA